MPSSGAGTCLSVLRHLPFTHTVSLGMVVSKGHAPLHSTCVGDDALLGTGLTHPCASLKKLTHSPCSGVYTHSLYHIFTYIHTYLYTYMCIYVCMYVCMYACMHACMYVCMYVCMYACLYACMHVCMYACMHVCMYACMHVCMYACMHVCVCICICTYIYIYMPVRTHTHTHAHPSTHICTVPERTDKQSTPAGACCRVAIGGRNTSSCRGSCKLS